MNVPFLDLVTPHKELEEELVSAFRQCLLGANFIGGPQVEGFETEFAKFCEAPFCVAVNSGTDALRFALIAAGVGEGDEVITVPNTFIATTEAISQCGARPAFVDIDEKTYNIDVNLLEDYLKGSSNGLNKRRPKAIVPVHLYGQVSNMDAICSIADRFGLVVIEDACQAHGASYYSAQKEGWQAAGSLGTAGAFSFYPGKNLGACGEGGAIVTKDESLARKMRMLRDHGQAKKYYHDIEGYNGRLDSIQAAFLRIKLEHLAAWNEMRRAHAEHYNTRFHGFLPIITPFEPEWSKSVFHLYVIRVSRRDELQKFLSDHQISTGLHYPVPLHMQNAYRELDFAKRSFPVTEKVTPEILSLPMYPQMSSDQVDFVASKVIEFFS